MALLKIWYHICANIKKLFYICVYRKKIHFGKKVTWRKSFNIMLNKNANLTIDDNCFFNNFCSININKEIVIGEGCLFGENVKIYDHNHRFRNTNIPIKGQGFSDGTVSIGNNCWIGSNVVILKDTIIGDNCVIGAGCVIKGIIPPKTIVKDNSELIYEQIKE